jgi:hypothetical protein
MTRKLIQQAATAVSWLIIAAGVVVIFLDAWHRIDARYASEGVVTESLMMIIMGGIPAIAFAAAVYFAFGFAFGTLKPPATPAPKEPPAAKGGHKIIN